MDGRLQCKQMATQIHDMQNSIQQHAQPLSNEMNDDFVKLFSGCDQANVPKFMKLFWEEQQKYVMSSPSSIRHHPMVIKFCL